MRYKQQFSGFTLIELLAVIAIIGILAALLFPMVKTMKRKAQDTQCVGNLKVWGTSLSTFIMDNGGVYKNWYTGTRTHPDPAQYWTYYMSSQAGYSVDQILKNRCPLTPPPAADNIGLHYGFNAADPYGKTTPNPGGTQYEIRFATHPRPASAILLGDSLRSDGSQFHTVFPANLLSRGGFHVRHNGRANLFFLDGHIEAASPERFRELGVTRIYGEDGTQQDTPTP